MLVDDHVANFNKNRACNYHPTDSICVYESMSRWYGTGGHWINYSLTQHIAIHRNPENRCHIQNDAEEFSGIMIQLNLFKTFSEEDIHYSKEHDGLVHGTKLIINILYPWVNNQWHVVSADSYVDSVQACDELKKRGLSFIGVVKTAARGFCMSKFSEIELANIGSTEGVLCY